MTAGRDDRRVWKLAHGEVREKEELLDDPSILHRVERDIMLQIVDAQWKDHLYSLDHLKEGIGLRGYGQRDPLVEYKKESFALFKAMKDRIDEEIVRYLWRLMPVISEDGDGVPPSPRRAAAAAPMTLSGPSAAAAVAVRRDSRTAARRSGRRRAAAARAHRRRRRRCETVRRDEPKVGRNDPCPCGSGKKYKKCHGA